MPHDNSFPAGNKSRSDWEPGLDSVPQAVDNSRPMQNQTVIMDRMSNREFLERYAQAGRVGLYGGITPVDTAIRSAQQLLRADGQWSDWSHVFLFEGQRVDGHHWVLESDIQIQQKNIQLGAQENRIAKYFDETLFPSLAVLDFGLNEDQAATLVRQGLELVARREQYSIRELIGTLIALTKPELRARENLFTRERSIYCSAFVQRLFADVGIDLVPGVTAKHSAPEDIMRSPVPHTKYLLQRPMPGPKSTALRKKIEATVRQRIARLKPRPDKG
jgi:hypothetical protein